jgi:UDP-N-acetylmuramyl pentapeptide phosphotransferase/UDP-N-acetylglucosamine-1-phosphate transferase
MPVVLLAVGLLGPRAGLPAPVFFAFLGGAIALYAVSLADDFLTLSTTVRFAVQFAAAGGFMAAVISAWPADAITVLEFTIPISKPGIGVPWSFGLLVFWSLLTLWLVASTNIYNFMDGIDGIAGVQAAVAGIAWCIFGALFSSPFVCFLGACVAAGALGFLTLNWPPAKMFMGDAGSTVLGYIFAAMPLLFVVESRQPASFNGSLIAAALVLWPFLVDGSFTILRRLKKRENILKAHRSHLYQRLVIAGKSHLQITLVYGGLALVGAGLAWRVVAGAPYAVATAVGIVALAFVSLWTWTIAVEKNDARR